MSAKPIPATSPDYTTPMATAINALIATTPERVPVPSTATGKGTRGQIAIGDEFLYVCVATNTWLRAALATF